MSRIVLNNLLYYVKQTGFHNIGIVNLGFYLNSGALAAHLSSYFTLDVIQCKNLERKF